MNTTQRTEVVASAIAHTIRTNGFEPTKHTVESIIGEVSKYDSYGTADKMWIAEIRTRHVPLETADRAYTELIRIPGMAGHSHNMPEAQEYFKQSLKMSRWVKKVARLALKSLHNSL